MVVFFDGVCNLCNRAADFIVRHDRVGRIRLAPLQGETARRELAGPMVQALDSIVVQDADGVHVRSEAALRIAAGLGGPWCLLAVVARLVPRALRDRVYDAIARRRYRWFGKRDTCRVPTPDERSRFLP
jgi:predicted DCC family thiol-disulfide oxidoreductase YuxK